MLIGAKLISYRNFKSVCMINFRERGSTIVSKRDQMYELRIGGRQEIKQK